MIDAPDRLQWRLCRECGNILLDTVFYERENGVCSKCGGTDWEAVKHYEDRLFNNKLIRIVERAHGFRYDRHARWQKIQGHECDVWALFKTEALYKRTVGFELKETNEEKVIRQAIVRRPLFNYFYIVFGGWTTMLMYYVLQYGRAIIENKLGIIIEVNGNYIMLLQSNYMPAPQQSMLDDYRGDEGE